MRISINRSTQKAAVKIIISMVRALFLIAFSYILIYPLAYMLSSSFKSYSDYADPTVVWVPKFATWSNFEKAMRVLNYFTNLWNTIKFEFVAAVISVFACAFIAYGLARFKFRFKRVLLFLLVTIIMVPDIMLIVPRMMTYKQLDLFGILWLFKSITGVDLRPDIVDSPLAFYLPSMFGVGLKSGLLIFIYMQFFKGLPYELEEAAWIDGAGPLQTFIRIIIPSSGVVFLTNFIFSVIWHWNDFFLAIMYTYQSRPLAVMIHDINQHIYLVLQYQHSGGENYGVPLAACVLFLLPPLIMYMFLQRKFIQSIDRVGIVG